MTQDNYHVIFSNKYNPDSNKKAKIRPSKLHVPIQSPTNDKHASRELSGPYTAMRGPHFRSPTRKPGCCIAEPRGHCARASHTTVVHELSCMTLVQEPLEESTGRFQLSHGIICNLFWYSIWSHDKVLQCFTWMEINIVLAGCARCGECDGEG